MADTTTAQSRLRTFWFGSSVIGLLVAVAALLIGLNRFPVRQGYATSDLDAVVAASVPLRYRPSLARLSGDFSFRDAKPRVRVSEKLSFDSTYAQLLTVITRLQMQSGQTPTPPQLHALGVSYLLLDNAKIAAKTLERALMDETKEKGEVIEGIRRSRNPSLLNDLAVAYETVVEQNDDLSLQPQALEAVERAWRIEKTPPIAWTRAVVTEGFHVR